MLEDQLVILWIILLINLLGREQSLSVKKELVTTL